mgnify:CR=1 FL=1
MTASASASPVSSTSISVPSDTFSPSLTVRLFTTPAAGDAGASADLGTASTVAPLAAAPSTPAAGGGTATAPPAPGAGRATGLQDLGALTNRAEFIAAARPFASAVPAPGTGPCPEYPPPLATATFQGTPAYLVVLEAVASGNRVALVAVDGCAVLVKADLSEG